MEKIGDGVAILQGTTERPGEQPLRQNNQFFYLTGVVEPRAIVDDRRADEKDDAVPAAARTSGGSSGRCGPALSPGAEAAAATGIDLVLPRDEFARRRGRLRAGPARPLHALQTRSARRSVVLGSRGDVAGDEGGRVGRPHLARRTVSPEAQGCLAAGGRGRSRSDRRRAAGDQEPARDRRHPRSDAHHRARRSWKRCGTRSRG